MVVCARGEFFLGTAVSWLTPQEQRPAPPRPPYIVSADRLAEIGRKLNSAQPVDSTAKRAIDYGRTFLAEAEHAPSLNKSFRAGRLADAADAVLRIADHQEHLRLRGGPKGPPSPTVVSAHLQRTYFQTQQLDYFLTQSGNRQVTSFPKRAREFYEYAIRAYERKDLIGAGENAKCAEEVICAPESVTQANAPATLPPERPRRAGAKSVS